MSSHRHVITRLYEIIADEENALSASETRRQSHQQQVDNCDFSIMEGKARIMQIRETLAVLERSHDS